MKTVTNYWITLRKSEKTDLFIFELGKPIINGSTKIWDAIPS